MIDETKRNIVLLLLVVFITMSIYFYNTNLQYKADFKNFKNFRSTSSELIYLQNKWKNKKENQKKLKQIIKLTRPSKHKQNKAIYQLTYENLNSKSIKKIGKLLLNSRLNIQELKLDKSTQNTLLYVEIIL